MASAVDKTVDVTAKDEKYLITTIPAGAQNVEVEMQSATPDHFDLSLHGEDGLIIVDWHDGLLSGPSGGITSYDGAEISWSGYAQPKETLSIDGSVPEDLKLYADPYNGGNTSVTYSWDGNNGSGDKNDGSIELGDFETEAGDVHLTAQAGEKFTIQREELLEHVNYTGDNQNLEIVDVGHAENGEFESILPEDPDEPVTLVTFTVDPDVDDAGFRYVASDGANHSIGDVSIDVVDEAPEPSAGEINEQVTVTAHDHAEHVVDIPAGVTDVVVEMVNTAGGSGQHDLYLTDADGNTEIVHWDNGLISGSGGSTTHAGAEIEWSGFGLEETLTIDGTLTEDLSLSVKPYGGGGESVVEYGWDENDNDGLGCDILSLAEVDGEMLHAHRDDLSWEQAINFIEGEKDWFFDSVASNIAIMGLSAMAAPLGTVKSELLGFGADAFLGLFESNLDGSPVITPHLILEEGEKFGETTIPGFPGPVLAIEAGSPFEIAGTIAPGSQPAKIGDIVIERGNVLGPGNTHWVTESRIELDQYSDPDYVPHTVSFSEKFSFDELGPYRLRMEAEFESEQWLSEIGNLGVYVTESLTNPKIVGAPSQGLDDAII
ncbi:hypothetical protein [Ectothiorhodospira variabilis]|uniref:hypothetical protein n=1 Tax=Ectothiorhodospira variabilis TaxID=505694 RepID=UPI001EFB3B5C|nr:hypothetical protein [Ectothiorhodospira variabilis]MCG5495846.1 hypothetical protein [Ectothiorhodospira variabilis]MCG5504547.1 hypothetical protein [Ectothiorhodospira variabilis]MCG5507746.1 hypothetical protein [Ectothiorhodospira variabilis]